MITKIIIVAFALLSMAIAQDDDIPLEEPRGHAEKLSNSTQFETGRIGEGGDVSQLSKSFLLLLEKRGAERILERIFNNSIAESGKAYALIGLRELKSPLYEKSMKAWPDAGKVKTLWFGISEEISVKQFKKLIQTGQAFEAISWVPNSGNQPQ